MRESCLSRRGARQDRWVGGSGGCRSGWGDEVGEARRRGGVDAADNYDGGSGRLRLRLHLGPACKTNSSGGATNTRRGKGKMGEAWSVYLSIHLSIYLSIYLFVCMSVCFFVFVHLLNFPGSTCLFIRV